MTSRRGRGKRRSPLPLAWALVAICLAGCGSDWPPVPQEEGSAAGPPTILAAKVVDSGVQVTYRVPGANGGPWPVLQIGVQAPGTLLPAESEDVRPVEEEGTVVVPIGVEPDDEVIVSGSALYEDGERVHLPEKSLAPPEKLAESTPEREPDQAVGGDFDGSWEATGKIVYVPPSVMSNQPVGTVRRRPWSFEEACSGNCRVVFTRGTLYGPSVTRLVKRGRFYIADFPPVRVPCSYPPNYPYPRQLSGQSHSRYKLWWSTDRTQLRAVEHRHQTGCYPTVDPPDITRWKATRVP